MALNQFIADDFIAHAIDLERFTAGERRRVLKVLKTLETNLVNEVRAAAFDEVKRTSFKQARLEKLLKQTQATIGTAYKRINKDHRAAMRELAGLEDELSRGLVNNNIGVDVLSVATSPDQLRRIADNTLINGAPSREWWGRQSTDLQRRFSDTMRQGVLMGETNQELVQRVRGTRRFGFNNGIMQAKRHQAEALVRSSVQTVSNKAREDSFANNADVLGGIEQLSTLDTKTTHVCKAYDQKVWRQEIQPDGSVKYIPEGHNLPYTSTDRSGQTHEGPPRHWNCRSTIIPVVKSWEELGATNIKTPDGGTAKGIDNLFKLQLKKQGKSKEEIAVAVRNARASMDGAIPEKTDYTEWLKRQVATGKEGRAIDALGRTRYEMWREGLITDTVDLVDQSGRELTIDELFERYGRPTGRKKPKPQPPQPPPVIEPTPPQEPMVFPAGETPEVIEWHKKSWVPEDTPEDLKDMLAKTPPLKGGVKVSAPDASKGAYYSPGGDFIHMHSSGWSSLQGTWRHEYGHHIDDVIGTRANISARMSHSHQGSSDYFFSHVKHDSDMIIKNAQLAGDNAYNNYRHDMLRSVDTFKNKEDKIDFVNEWLRERGLSDFFDEMKRDFPDLPIWKDVRLFAQVAQDAEASAAQRKLTKRWLDSVISTWQEKGLPTGRGLWNKLDLKDELNNLEQNFIMENVEAVKEALNIKLAEAGAPITADDLVKLTGIKINNHIAWRGLTTLAEAIAKRDSETFLRFMFRALDTELIDERDLYGLWSDYIGSITQNKVGRGHAESYYARSVGAYKDVNDKVLGTFSADRTGEAFANWVALRSWQGGRSSVNQRLIEWFTPNTHRGYTKMINKYIINWSE